MDGDADEAKFEHLETGVSEGSKLEVDSGKWKTKHVVLN